MHVFSDCDQASCCGFYKLASFPGSPSAIRLVQRSYVKIVRGEGEPGDEAIYKLHLGTREQSLQ